MYLRTVAAGCMAFVLLARSEYREIISHDDTVHYRECIRAFNYVSEIYVGVLDRRWSTHPMLMRHLIALAESLVEHYAWGIAVIPPSGYLRVRTPYTEGGTRGRGASVAYASGDATLIITIPGLAYQEPLFYWHMIPACGIPLGLSPHELTWNAYLVSVRDGAVHQTDSVSATIPKHIPRFPTPQRQRYDAPAGAYQE